MKKEAFRNPQDIFRGTDFWMLNGSLSDEEIVYQLTEMRDKGVYSFIARTYLGLKSDYPGPDFKAKTKLIIDTSRELGLKVFLQAGYMPEAVLGLPENAALRYIYPVRQGEEDGRPILCQHDEWSFVEHNSVTFLDMFDSDAMDYYIKTSYEDMWSEFADEYGKTVISIWVDEPSYNALYLPWTPKLEEIFLDRWGYKLSEKVWMLYFDCDEAKSVRYHYRVTMRDLLEENYFKRIASWCKKNNLMFSGHLMMEETMKSQISRALACMPYYKYFDIPGIDVLRADMAWNEDPIKPSEPPIKRYVLHTTVTQCVSAAKQAGKEHILAEMYGVGGENFTFRNMTHMFDTYAAAGINHRSVHGIFYSLHGRGKRAYPPHISYYQPFWTKYKNVTDYCARVSEFISEGRSSANIAIIHPLETGYMLYKGAFGAPTYGSAELDRHDIEIYDILTSIRSQNHQVDFVDLTGVRDMGSVENGKLRIGKMEYDTVILPNLQVVTPELISLLKKLSAEGGKIITYGNTPYMLDGFVDAGLSERIDAISTKANTISDILNALDTPTYHLSGIGVSNLLINHRICENGERFFICNKDCAHRSVFKLTTKCTGALYMYDAYSGECREYPYTIENGLLTAEINIDEGDSILLSVEDKRQDALTAIGNPLLSHILRADGEWTVDPLSKNALLLEFCQYRKGDGDFSSRLPIMAVHYLLSKEEYRGEITLRYLLDVSDNLEGISLALEDPTLQKIILDGNVIDNTPTGYFRDRSFETITLGNLTIGRHILDVTREFHPLTKVTNALTQLFETRHGIELEPMYLLGDFKVCGKQYSSENGCVVFERDFKLNKQPKEIKCYGEITTEGFPFYTGEIILSREIYIPDGLDTQNAVLNIDVMNAGCGELFVNGRYAGDINRAPCRICVGHLLKVGANKLEIKLYTTLYNVIGPFHRPLGDVGNTFGGGYANPDAAWLSINTAATDWHTRMNDFKDTWTDRYNVVPLGVKNIYLTF